MKVKAGCKFHNRFVIEKRDAITNELKQKGYAENIILDRAWTRVCNFQTYFTNIVFGKGTGNLLSSRDTLFNRLGYKAAVNEEVIKAYPISKWTRKITLNPEEYVGETLKEVGISDTTTNINTHALIKDAEGKELSITKTNLDVIVMYATVFIELQNLNEDFIFTNFPNDNALINYFLSASTTTVNNIIEIGKYYNNSSIVTSLFARTGTRVIDVENRKVTISTRYPINEANASIQDLTWKNILRCHFPQVGIFEMATVKTEGIGDAEKVRFIIPWHNISNLVVRVDGSVVTNYQYKNVYPLKEIIPHELVEYVEGTLKIFDGNLSTYETGTMSFTRPTNLPEIYGAKFHIYSPGAGNAWGPYTLTLQGSYDDITWVTLGTISHDQSQYSSFEGDLSIILAEPADHNKFKLFSSKGSAARFHEVNLYSPGSYIIFDSAPSEDSVISMEYKVPYVPKTKDYVLDVKFELQFGEGV